MPGKTKIEWTETTWNVCIGCRRVSAGCEACYAEKQARRIVAMQRASSTGVRSPYEDVVKMDADGNPRPLWNGRAVFLPERLDQPLRWRKPRKVFVNSMSDLFHEDVTFEQIAAVFGVMAATPRHTFQCLSKRPKRMLEFMQHNPVEMVAAWLYRGGRAGDSSPTERGYDGEDHRQEVRDEPEGDFCDLQPQDVEAYLATIWPLPNVWLGVSCEDQATADERIPLLLQCPAAVRFVSAEPLLGPVDFGEIALHGAFDHCPDDGANPHNVPEEDWIDPCEGCAGWGEACGAVRGPSLDWVIVGGESGTGSRPCNIDWARSIVEQCGAAAVACFVKQLGAHPGEALAPSECDVMGCTYGSLLPMDLKDRKGGDPDEWPEDLRVRQMPEVLS